MFVFKLKSTFMAFSIWVTLHSFGNNILLPFIKTVGTKPMIWSGIIVRFLIRINKKTFSKGLKFILFFLLLPVFIFHQFCFYLIFNVGQFLMLGIYGKELLLEIEKRGLKFDDYLIPFDIDFVIMYSLVIVIQVLNPLSIFIISDKTHSISITLFAELTYY